MNKYAYSHADFIHNTLLNSIALSILDTEIEALDTN